MKPSNSPMRWTTEDVDSDGDMDVPLTRVFFKEAIWQMRSIVVF